MINPWKQKEVEMFYKTFRKMLIAVVLYRKQTTRTDSKNLNVRYVHRWVETSYIAEYFGTSICVVQTFLLKLWKQGRIEGKIKQSPRGHVRKTPNAWSLKKIPLYEEAEKDSLYFKRKLNAKKLRTPYSTTDSHPAEHGGNQ